MNMDETKLYSWFLGPKAENADMLERLILEALRDCVFWRRNFHPETDEALNLRSRLYAAHARRRADLPQDEIKKQVDQQLSAYSISGKGIQRFFSELRGEAVVAPLALVPATAHYSMQKVIEALGLGKQQMRRGLGRLHQNPFLRQARKPCRNSQRDPRDHADLAVGRGLPKLQRSSSRRLDHHRPSQARLRPVLLRRDRFPSSPTPSKSLR
jgi:hypothetical protein